MKRRQKVNRILASKWRKLNEGNSGSEDAQGTTVAEMEAVSPRGSKVHIDRYLKDLYLVVCPLQPFSQKEWLSEIIFNLSG